MTNFFVQKVIPSLPNELHKNIFQQLLPFRRLRHICTHPQLDQEAFKFVDIFIERGAKLTLTVFEFVDWLVKRAAMRCQQQYKLQVVALNGMAFMKLYIEVLTLNGVNLIILKHLPHFILLKTSWTLQLHNIDE